MHSGQEHESTLAPLSASRLSPRLLPRVGRLLLEALIYTAVAVFIAVGWGIEQSGALSVFLVAAGISPRFRHILDENSDNIWLEGWSGLRANATTAWSVLAMFLGVLIAYTAVALMLPASQIETVFGFALELAHIEDPTEPTRRFGTFQALALHELTMVVGFFGLAFIYRAYAAVLAIAFDACVWASMLVLTVEQRGGEAASLADLALSMALLLPTLLLDGFALLTACLAGIFLSKGLFRYPLSDPRLGRVLRAGLYLVGVSALIGLAAVSVEWNITPRVLTTLP
jgi:hypothetical protein